MTWKIYTLVHDDGSDVESDEGARLFYSFQDALDERGKDVSLHVVEYDAMRMFSGCSCSGKWKDLK